MESNSFRQLIQYATAGLLIVAGVWLFITLQPLISALIIAALLAYILHPLVNLLIRKTGISHKGAVTVVYLLFLLMLIAIPAILTPITIAQTREFAPDIDALTKWLETLPTMQFVFAGYTFSLDTVFADLEASITTAAAQVATNLGFVLADVTTNLLWVLIVLVSVYYLLRDSHRLLAWVQAFIPERYHPQTVYLLREMDMVWGSFLRGQLLLMLIVGVLSWIGTMAVGMPAAFIVGIIAGVLDIIPSLGPTFAAVIAIAIALFEGSTYLPVSNVFFALIVLVIFLVIQQIENIWIRPALMGRQLRLHPAIVFISVLTSLALFGILVTLIIIPVMASMSVVARYVRQRMHGIDPALPPDD